MVAVSLDPAQYFCLDHRPCCTPAPPATLPVAAWSAHFAVPDLALYDELRVCGFPIEEGPEKGSEEDAALEEWLRRGPALVLWLGSLPSGSDVLQVTAALEAARCLGLRLLVAAGSGRTEEHETLAKEIGARRDGEVSVVHGATPGHWMAEATVVLHSGGMTTTAVALCAGVPVLLLPQRTEHYLYAQIVQRMGVGTAMDRQKVSGENLARAIERRCFGGKARAACASLAQRLETDSGLAAIAVLVEQALARRLSE